MKEEKRKEEESERKKGMRKKEGWVELKSTLFE
jgi:hypothetical protein